MQNLEHIRYISANYEDMQGLRQLPLGLVVLTVGGLSIASSNNLIEGLWVALMMVVVVIGGAIISDLIARWYRNTYGNIQSNRKWILEAVLAGVVIIASLAETHLHLPFSFAMLIIGLYYVYQWRLANNLLPHYLFIGLIAIIATALPQVVQSEDLIAWYMVVVGVMISLAGIFDHNTLTQNLSRVNE